MCNNRDESEMNYANEKSQIQIATYYYMIFCKKQNDGEEEEISGCRGIGEERGLEFKGAA